MSWGPPLSPRDALRVYGLGRDDVVLLALAGHARADGRRLRLAASDPAEVREMLEAARATHRIRGPLASWEVELEAGDLLALLEAMEPAAD